MFIRDRLEDIKQLQELNEELRRKVRDFTDKWKRKAEGVLSAADRVQFDAEWLEIKARGEFLEREAIRLGVGTGNN